MSAAADWTRTLATAPAVAAGSTAAVFWGPTPEWAWAVIITAALALLAGSVASDVRAVRAAARYVPCVGCSTDTIRYLWVDVPAAIDDYRTARILGVCDSCRAEQGCEVHVRFPEPRQLRPNHARLLAYRHARVLDRIAGRRARTAWARQFSARTVWTSQETHS